MVFKFAGVDSIDDAEKLFGAEIQIPREQRADVEEGTFYISDLVGCAVSARTGTKPRQSLGEVTDVIFGAGEAPLLQIRSGKKEYLVPFVEAFIERMDLGNRQIDMNVPEGLLELDAPLSREERERQARGQQED